MCRFLSISPRTLLKRHHFLRAGAVFTQLRSRRAPDRGAPLSRRGTPQLRSAPLRPRSQRAGRQVRHLHERRRLRNPQPGPCSAEGHNQTQRIGSQTRPRPPLRTQPASIAGAGWDTEPWPPPRTAHRGSVPLCHSTRLASERPGAAGLPGRSLSLLISPAICPSRTRTPRHGLAAARHAMKRRTRRPGAPRLPGSGGPRAQPRGAAPNARRGHRPVPQSPPGGRSPQPAAGAYLERGSPARSPAFRLGCRRHCHRLAAGGGLREPCRIAIKGSGAGGRKRRSRHLAPPPGSLPAALAPASAQRGGTAKSPGSMGNASARVGRGLSGRLSPRGRLAAVGQRFASGAALRRRGPAAARSCPWGRR